jgi:hypothetical protein
MSVACPTNWFGLLASVQIAIEVKETIFTGGLKYDENDMLYREIAQHQAQFVGRPGPDIDAAWDNLLARKCLRRKSPSQNFSISKLLMRPISTWNGFER